MKDYSIIVLVGIVVVTSAAATTVYYRVSQKHATLHSFITLTNVARFSSFFINIRSFGHIWAILGILVCISSGFKLPKFHLNRINPAGRHIDFH